jgi:hypothetical protein
VAKQVYNHPTGHPQSSFPLGDSPFFPFCVLLPLFLRSSTYSRVPDAEPSQTPNGSAEPSRVPYSTLLLEAVFFFRAPDAEPSRSPTGPLSRHSALPPVDRSYSFPHPRAINLCPSRTHSRDPTALQSHTQLHPRSKVVDWETLQLARLQPFHVSLSLSSSICFVGRRRVFERMSLAAAVEGS